MFAYFVKKYLPLYVFKVIHILFWIILAFKWIYYYLLYIIQKHTKQI